MGCGASSKPVPPKVLQIGSGKAEVAPVPAPHIKVEVDNQACLEKIVAICIEITDSVLPDLVRISSKLPYIGPLCKAIEVFYNRLQLCEVNDEKCLKLAERIVTVAKIICRDNGPAKFQTMNVPDAKGLFAQLDKAIDVATELVVKYNAENRLRRFFTCSSYFNDFVNAEKGICEAMTNLCQAATLNLPGSFGDLYISAVNEHDEQKREKLRELAGVEDESVSDLELVRVAVHAGRINQLCQLLSADGVIMLELLRSCVQMHIPERDAKTLRRIKVAAVCIGPSRFSKPPLGSHPPDKCMAQYASGDKKGQWCTAPPKFRVTVDEFDGSFYYCGQHKKWLDPKYKAHRTEL